MKSQNALNKKYATSAVRAASADARARQFNGTVPHRLAAEAHTRAAMHASRAGLPAQAAGHTAAAAGHRAAIESHRQSMAKGVDTTGQSKNSLVKKAQAASNHAYDKNTPAAHRAAMKAQAAAGHSAAADSHRSMAHVIRIHVKKIGPGQVHGAGGRFTGTPGGAK